MPFAVDEILAVYEARAAAACAETGTAAVAVAAAVGTEPGITGPPMAAAAAEAGGVDSAR